MARNLQPYPQLLLMQPATLQLRVFQLLGLFLIGLLIYIGQDIIVPLGFSFVIAISLLPVYRLFKRLRLPDVVAIILSILCGVIVIGAIIFILSLEFSSMLENKDVLKANVDKHIEEIGLWIQDKTGMNLKAQQAFFKKQMDGAGTNAGGLLASTATTIGGYLVWFGLVPIYVFLILFYKNLLVRFIFLASKTEQHDLVEESIRDGESTVKNYLLGLLIEMLILAVLVTIVLTLFGIHYAILIGAIFAVLNMIPYLGALIANILAILITLSTSADISDAIWVVVILAVIQFVDNNFIMPNLVGSKVRINALVTVMAVIIGQSLAGVGGMFLSIPAVAVLKVIFDKTQSMKHWAVLFGDDNPKLNALQYPVMRLRKRIFRED